MAYCSLQFCLHGKCSEFVYLFCFFFPSQYHRLAPFQRSEWNYQRDSLCWFVKKLRFLIGEIVCWLYHQVCMETGQQTWLNRMTLNLLIQWRIKCLKFALFIINHLLVDCKQTSASFEASETPETVETCERFPRFLVCWLFHVRLAVNVWD